MECCFEVPSFCSDTPSECSAPASAPGPEPPWHVLNERGVRGERADCIKHEY